MADEPDGSGTATRGMWLIAAALLLGAAALWGSSELTWVAEQRDLSMGATTLHTETGSEHTAALVPLAVLSLAAIAGVVATGGWARRVLGAVLVVAGAAVVAVGVVDIDLGDGSETVSIVAGRGLAVLAGLLLVGAGSTAVRLARRMPRLGSRYAAPANRRSQRDPDTELWDRLSAGDDPTAGE